MIIYIYIYFFSNTAADTASEYDSCGHHRSWTAAASCPYYSCRRRAKPVGFVLPCVCRSRIRAKPALIWLLRALLAHFLTCNFWYQLKSLTIPETTRHPTRETQEHRVTTTHFAAAPSAYGCSCRMCDILGRMVLVKKTAPIKFLCWCLLWFAKRRDVVAFLRCTHTAMEAFETCTFLFALASCK